MKATTTTNTNILKSVAPKSLATNPLSTENGTIEKTTILPLVEETKNFRRRVDQGGENARSPLV